MSYDENCIRQMCVILIAVHADSSILEHSYSVCSSRIGSKQFAVVVTSQNYIRKYLIYVNILDNSEMQNDYVNPTL